MSDLITLPGRFAQPPPLKIVAVDNPANGTFTTHVSDKTNGALITTPLPTSPTLSAKWTILGFTVQVRMAVLIPGAGSGYQYWARLGELWAGIITDVSIPPVKTGTAFEPIWPPAEFPADLSSFTKIWDGATDTISGVTNVTNTPPLNFTLITGSLLLPFPPSVPPGTQMGFALILTPSILDAVLVPLIRDAQFTITYSLGS